MVERLMKHDSEGNLSNKFKLLKWLCCRVDCCVRCIAQGVHTTHIIDGRQNHSLLMELLTDEGVGTMITG